jgi:DNA-binding Lrp family transcriptional regulator
MRMTETRDESGVGKMPSEHRAVRVDARLLLALSESPGATTIALADRIKLSRNTVQPRMGKLDEAAALRSFERRIDPAVLGYPLQAYVLTNVTQRKLARVGAALHEKWALEVHDLYRVAGYILGIKGVKRTTTALVMRELVDYRINPLVEKIAE